MLFRRQETGAGVAPLPSPLWGEARRGSLYSSFSRRCFSSFLTLNSSFQISRSSFPRFRPIVSRRRFSSFLTLNSSFQISRSSFSVLH